MTGVVVEQRDELAGLTDSTVCARAQSDVVDELVHVEDENSYLNKAAEAGKAIDQVNKQLSLADVNDPNYEILRNKLLQLQSSVDEYNSEAHRRRAMNFDRSVNNDIAHGFQTPFGATTNITVERTKKTPPLQRVPREVTTAHKKPAVKIPENSDIASFMDTESEDHDILSVMDTDTDSPVKKKPQPKAKKFTKRKPSPPTDILSVMDSDSSEEQTRVNKVKARAKQTTMSAFKKALNKKGGRQVANKSQLQKKSKGGSSSESSTSSADTKASVASLDALLAEAGVADMLEGEGDEKPDAADVKKNTEDGSDPMQGHINKFAKEYFKLVGHNVIDDGCPHSYKYRLKRTEMAREKVKMASKMAKNIKKRIAQTILDTNKSEDEDSLSPDDDHSTMDDDDDEEEVVFSSSTGNASEKLRLSSWVWDSLFKYQQTCVKWLWELHTQQVGGIVGDEMGLGKTVQICSFLSGLHRSGLLRRPVLIACPVTLIKQWVREFHKWAPDIRCVVMHSSGSYQGSREALIKSIDATSTVVITTYHAIAQDIVMLAQYGFQYVILDEGHMIRNHKSISAQTVKQFPTPHRLVLTGSPLQNKLTELWALFDFIYPGKLGDLPTFKKVFEAPINTAGFSFAQPSQVTLAYKMCLKLRDLTAPYLLRRLKADVLELPEKKETVLFCKLALPQIIAYVEFLKSDAMRDVMAKQINAQNARYRQQDKIYAAPARFDDEPHAVMDAAANPLNCIHILRKICNYPGLYKDVETDLNISTSGKLKVVAHLLPKWKSEGHKCLIFSQTRAMLDILEYMMKVKYNYGYIRIDGTTTVADRLPLIDKYNKDPNVFVAILTPKVGGVGLNLTGANRILIYDPDWNPITDIQARERAWRVGQKRDVVIYRLVTSGTIEEQIYKRQVFKAHLTHRVLNDPDNNKVFESSDVKTMFSLGSEYKEIYRNYRNQLSKNRELPAQTEDDTNPITNQQDIVSTDVGYSIRKTGQVGEDDDDDFHLFFKPEPVKLPSERARAMSQMPPKQIPGEPQKRTVKIADSGATMQKRPNVTISAAGETRSASAPDDIQNTQMLMGVIDGKKLSATLHSSDKQVDAEAQWVADQAEAEIRKSGMPIMKKMKWAGHTTLAAVRPSSKKAPESSIKRKNSEREGAASNNIKEAKLLDVHQDIIARGTRSVMTQQIEEEKAAQKSKVLQRSSSQVTTIVPPPPKQPKPDTQSRRSTTGFKAPKPKPSPQQEVDDLFRRRSHSSSAQLYRPDGKSIPLTQSQTQRSQPKSQPTNKEEPHLTRGIPLVVDEVPVPDLEDQIRLCIGPEELTSQDIAASFSDIIGDGKGQVSQLDFRKRLSKIAYYQKVPKTWKLRQNQHLL
eukprot:TRINITY_DN8273_c0_g1_i1.p1 TRINITY_DN8273_c0_g1~~TRINITY_DN8273_c0_g1_i1.p1  ORF type:complete len:1507 (+),score=322.75 TRINITY_DN8273_c0_g1_i1:444-4523(+)